MLLKELFLEVETVTIIPKFKFDRVFFKFSFLVKTLPGLKDKESFVLKI